MLFEGPDQRLYLARLRQSELRAEAAAVRRTHHSIDARRPIEQVRGLNLRIGRLLIVVGRTLRDDEACRPDPIHS